MQSLSELIDQAREHVSNMTVAQLDEMLRLQALSYARSFTTKCEHGVLDFEQCPRCRELYSKKENENGTQ